MVRSTSKYWHSPFGKTFGARILFEEDNGGGSGGSGGEGESKDEGKPKTFTQEQLNHEIGLARKKANERVTELMQKMDEIQTKMGVSEEEKTRIRAELEEVQNKHLTETQRLQRDLGTLQGKYKTDVETLTEQVGSWRQRFESQQMRLQVREACSAKGQVAFDAEQVHAMLAHFGMSVKEEKDTGKFETIVKYPDLDDAGKPVVVELPVSEAVKRMAENEKFINLFDHGQQDGTGLRSEMSRSSGSVDFKKMTPAQYAKWVKEHPNE